VRALLGLLLLVHLRGLHLPDLHARRLSDSVSHPWTGSAFRRCAPVRAFCRMTYVGRRPSRFAATL